MTAGMRQPKAWSPEEQDAGGDRELAHLGMRPRDLVAAGPAQRRFGPDAAVDDRLAVLGVVDLVEHVLGGRAELPEPEGRGDEQDQRHGQGVAVAAGGVLDESWAGYHLLQDLFKYLAGPPTV